MAKARKEVVAPRYRLRVKQRLAIVEYAVAHSLLAASRRFGLDRKTIREWRDRWRQHGIAGLVPRYPARRKSRVPEDVMRLLEHARRELGYGAPRTRIWLRRVHKRDLPAATIQRSSVDFLNEVRRALPFPIRRLQCDNGTEFSLAFALSVQEAGIRHRYIKPRCPEQNGKVERSHRVDAEEFWARQTFIAFEAAALALRGWDRRSAPSPCLSIGEIVALLCLARVHCHLLAVRVLRDSARHPVDFILELATSTCVPFRKSLNRVCCTASGFSIALAIAASRSGPF